MCTQRFLHNSYRLAFIAAAMLFATACHHREKTYDNTAPAWYKNQLIYNLDVKTFKDSDGNGTGDFNGLTKQLDYLRSLGVGIIWLAPFQPSPLQDDGYDVTDYYGIDSSAGNREAFHAFMNAAAQRHMHVIMDIALNHSSLKHPWFIADTARHNWYVWSAQRPHDWNKGTGFPGVEQETWTYYPPAKAYYYHRFYRFEPDLNFQNPAVVAEAKHILEYWLKEGVDGFRLDAVPFVIDDPRKSSEHPAHDFEVLHQLAAFVKKKKPGAVLLGEANISPKESKDYFSSADNGLDMMFNFEANEYLFYALATGDAAPFRKAMTVTAEKPALDQWAYFLRNHDEIDLGKLNHHQLSQAYAAFGPDSSMQLYQRGIRRRLAPMLHNDKRRLQQAYALLFALPGTPVIRYGEEIGMGDKLSLKERLAIRTPMQWNSTRNGGFSSAAIPFRPLIDTGMYGYRVVNVAAEEADDNSLLQFIRKMSRLRAQNPMIGEGWWELPECSAGSVFAILYHAGNNRLLICINFSPATATAVIQVPLPGNTVTKNLVSGKTDTLNVKHGKLQVNLPGYACKWYRF